MNEKLLKTSGADVLCSRKKTQKNLMGGGGGGIHPHTLVRPRVNSVKIIIFVIIAHVRDTKILA